MTHRGQFGISPGHEAIQIADSGTASADDIVGYLMLFGLVLLRQRRNFDAAGTALKFHGCGKFGAANSINEPALR